MKVAKNTEIEIRGKLGKKVFRKTFSQLKKSGRLINHYKRLSVDLSPGFDSKSRSWKSDDQIDLRVKKSGNSEKISLKIGKIHAKKRQEIEIRLKKGEFLNSVSLLENLGFNKGMIYFWESWEFEYKGCEVKLSKYSDNYFTWEIETINHKLDLYDLAKSLNLVPFTKQGYNRAIDWGNKNIHNIYSYNLVEKLIKKF
ncbi:hypothetical protein A2686_05190 [Candidatus Woesebacteria bacterium RIFCSPHIGHO2_01_FULL_38_10]|uniref:CYTH domain-containing protein n=1 Tax=Candidatus Woesebacteria bacterium RIFCSPLOWO2_01_FULL_39_10b TaxID=1802517 RepID=A0A1F8B654_9BACT|nr:MAG: hypothetical protein A2686_05190 [Candidatus Woesebacteria bacterium RIFCSPHIGHO2_01_FULL_38_10]OGM59511.1 MAG: hypothetical protein A2892_02630 [Candidatus Woesebacteria bacterium RIFCSPLOWO2_01_FULL_39_10b]